MKREFICLLCTVIAILSVTAGIRFISGIGPGIPGSRVSTAYTSEFPDPAADHLLDVPVICQYPDLPTGCESVAATMVLQFYGVDITPVEFAYSYLACSDNFYRADGILYGPDPEKVFAGNPFKKQSYGCFTKPIVDAVNKNSSCMAQEITGLSVEELCREYIDRGKPILIWATMGMEASYLGNSWHLEDGSLYTWIAGEHCLVLVGHNDESYFLNDPMTGSIVHYPKSVVEKRFAELGKRSVFISRL